MNEKIKIPKGWRKLKEGDFIRPTDKAWNGTIGEFRKTSMDGFLVGQWGTSRCYIRRKTRVRK